jgi:hypothetical protein
MNLTQQEATHLNVTVNELKEAQAMACNYFNNNIVAPQELSVYGYEAILKGNCKSELSEEDLTLEELFNKVDEIMSKPIYQ